MGSVSSGNATPSPPALLPWLERSVVAALLTLSWSASVWPVLPPRGEPAQPAASIAAARKPHQIGIDVVVLRHMVTSVIGPGAVDGRWLVRGIRVPAESAGLQQAAVGVLSSVRGPAMIKFARLRVIARPSGNRSSPARSRGAMARATPWPAARNPRLSRPGGPERVIPGATQARVNEVR